MGFAREMRLMMRWLLLAVMTLCLPLAAGCGGAAPSGAAPGGGKTLIYARAGESRKLDPVNEDSGESVKVIINIFETLVTYDDQTADLVPALAETWEASADGKTWTFHLRKGVQFHDGTPCDAAAVVFSLERLILPDHPQLFDKVRPYAPTYQEDIAKVSAPDPATVVIELKQPSAVFLPNLAMFSASIVSPTAVKAHGEQFAIQPVGTGPYRFESWDRDKEIVLAANDRYWRGRPQIDRVVFIKVLEPALRIEQLRRGEVNFVDSIPPAEFRTLRGEPNLKLLEADGMNVGYLAMNLDRPPLDDPDLRKAIALSINKQELISICFGGDATAAVNPVPREMRGWHADAIEDRTPDVAAAKKLVEDVARRRGLALPIPLNFFLMTSARPYMPEPQKTASYLKQQLQAIGLEITLVPSEISQHFQRTSRGEHDLCILGWSSDNADPDNFLYQLFDIEQINDHGGNNVSRYRSPEAHALLMQGKHELDRARREALYHEVQAMIFRDIPVVPLVHLRQQVATAKHVHGFTLHPTGLIRLGKVYFDEKGK